MQIDKQYQTSLATCEGLIHLITGLAVSVTNPDHQSKVRSLQTEQKVAASIRKQCAKHMPVEKN